MSVKESLLIGLFTKGAFLLFIFSQVFFQNTLINRVAMIFLTLMVLLLCLTKKKIYFHYYFVFNILLIIQSYYNSVNGISINPSISLSMTSTLILNLIIALSIYNYILIQDDLENSLYSFANIGILLGIFMIILSLFSGQLFSGRLGQNIDLQILGDRVSYNANMIAIISGFSYLIFIYKFYKTQKISNVFFILFIILVILLTGSRKGFLILTLGTPLLVFILHPRKWLRNLYLLIILSLLLYLVTIKIPILYNIIGFRIEALVGQLMGKEVQEASVETRSLYVERGWSYFLLKPWNGYGLDTFRILPGSYGTYSHNNFIELLVSGGVVSFVLYYIIRLFALIKIFLNLNVYTLTKLMFVFVFLLLILDYGLVSYFERIYIILFMFVLCSLSLIRRREGK